MSAHKRMLSESQLQWIHDNKKKYAMTWIDVGQRFGFHHSSCSCAYSKWLRKRTAKVVRECFEAKEAELICDALNKEEK